MTDHAPVIDSHLHLRGPGDSQASDPDALKPFLDDAGVTATVLVQTHSELDETRDLLRIASGVPFVAGVIGWADLADPHVGNTLENLRGSQDGSWLVGLQHRVEDDADGEWFGREDVQLGLNTLADAGLVYDILVHPRHLPLVLNVASDFPHLHIVIDHLGLPDIANANFEAWDAAIHEFAGLENVACKLSGLFAGVGASWTVDAVRPYVRTAVEVFGPHRLMFGSAWSASPVAPDYAITLRATRDALTGLDVEDEDIDAVFGRTAIHWYGLESRVNVP